ncbi:hypothetical protein M5X11_14685 [Paenibacillus alginolyticus]|uniref:hypothetical protein n=1 Tax=Paenibacillus alginolyticus TaxID=59839 RepID=UPI00040A4370|nr:hypothetical protein [Paenibacillus alginolyticus]MCY9666198.1 hypothetical protein [Paenibacillus alginolyticus]
MKTILWATLTGNGNYAQSSPNNPPKKEALGDFAAHAQAAGNFIVGRRTFEGMQASGGGGAFAGMDIVIVSASVKEIPGVTVVGSPLEALSYLQDKGYQTALISGGGGPSQCFSGSRAC